jgi:hypothetical protein
MNIALEIQSTKHDAQMLTVSTKNCFSGMSAHKECEWHITDAEWKKGSGRAQFEKGEADCRQRRPEYDTPISALRKALAHTRVLWGKNYCSLTNVSILLGLYVNVIWYCRDISRICTL